MPRRRTVTPTGPGEGRINIQLPLLSLIGESLPIDDYLRLVRSGALDVAGRPTKFSSMAEDVENLRSKGRDLPDGLPRLEGDVTWRRGERRWSLDATCAYIEDNVLFWSSIGGGLAQIRFDGVRLPDTLLDNLPGRPLRDVAPHRHFDDPRIVIASCTSGGPYRPVTPLDTGRPAMTTFKITVPSITVDDPLVDQKQFQRKEDA